jgi:hypothetical protein
MMGMKPKALHIRWMLSSDNSQNIFHGKARRRKEEKYGLNLCVLHVRRAIAAGQIEPVKHIMAETRRSRSRPQTN